MTSRLSQKLVRSQLPLRALTAWRYLPRSDQSCLCRANRRTAFASLHHLPQVINMRSRIRSFNCNSFLAQVGVCMYTCYTAVLLRKTSRNLLSLDANIALAICIPLHIPTHSSTPLHPNDGVAGDWGNGFLQTSTF